ncbi:hypothetical protein NEOLEDRAFT_624108 [Neolentinus lepideus HHB14362 ss-1]|uniref:Uncharacterized protein n=1 Tax=Neolentinus lepideus HHB14362 ss-1 TaxID=1314782 RepID=A0A165QTY6_9AGAM|nr:hypothetical protein NEOLEDRAFT_624108 [Neolentinus lepideus HHB14362 ss-1]
MSRRGRIVVLFPTLDANRPLQTLLDSDPVPLPNNFTHSNFTVVGTYRLCRQDEKAILHKLEVAHEKTELTTFGKHLINIRILGHWLDKGPSHTVVAHIAQEIVVCASSQKGSTLYSDSSLAVLRGHHSTSDKQSSR